jgi:uncharacterized membrane protein (DUF373 family)
MFKYKPITSKEDTNNSEFSVYPGDYALNYMESFHKAIITILTGLMGLVVMLATLELIYLIAMDILSPPMMLLEIDELLDIFGYFLLILIGVELLETLRIYLKEHALNVQVVLLVAMIAIARKVIILDSREIESLTLIGIGFIIFSLAAGYYLVKKSQDEPTCKRL